nr:interleukin-11 [Salvelinus alpinus]
MVLPWLRKQMTTTLMMMLAVQVLVDSSSSLLLSLLLAQLPLFTSAVPAPYRRPNVVHELDRLANQTKNLRQITADLLMRPTLSQLHADLKSFEHHFAWLSRASRKHHHPALPKLGQMMSLIKSLTSMLEHQMMRVDAQRLSPPSPSMPPHPSQFDVLQSSQELLLQFRLFCDWAQRVFSVLSTKSKMSEYNDDS